MKHYNIIYLVVAAALMVSYVSKADTSASGAYCDSVCPLLVGSDGKAASLVAGSDWTAGDDAWCSQYGDAALAMMALLPGESTQQMIIRSYNTPTLAAGFPKTVPPQPAITQNSLFMCSYHQNSQAVSYCLAYESAKGAQPQEHTLMALDMAATVTCGAACAAKVAPDVTSQTILQKACTVAGGIDTVAEVLGTFTMQNQGAGVKLGALMGVANLAKSAGVGTAGATVPPPNITSSAVQAATSSLNNATTSLSTAQASYDAANAANDAAQKLVNDSYNMVTNAEEVAARQSTVNLQTAQDALTQAQTDFNSSKTALGNATGAPSKVTGQTGATSAQKGQRQACMSAAFFAIESGLRMMNIKSEDGAKGNACNSLVALNGNQATPIVTVSVGGGVGGNVTGNATGGSSGATGATSGTTTPTATASGTCLNPSSGTVYSCLPYVAPRFNAATDAGVLSSSGLLPQLTPLAQSMIGQNPAGGSGGGSGGGGDAGTSGDIKTALADLAQMAAASPGDVPGGVSTSAGGGNLAHGASDSSNPFANLFGNKDGGSGAGVDQATAFDKSSPDDIFHSKSNLSLFQIVSQKLTKVNTRINHLDWQSPQNRALAGLPRNGGN